MTITNIKSFYEERRQSTALVNKYRKLIFQ